MSGNWTKEEVRRAVITELEINQKPRVHLDVEHADACNITNIIAWCKAMGYKAEEISQCESVRVEKVGTI